MHFKYNIQLFLAFFIFFLSGWQVLGQNTKPIVSETFTNQNRVRSGITIGGIGTGGMELRKDGQFYNWSIFNNYPLGVGPLLDLPVPPFSNEQESFLYFLVRYQVEGEQPKIKLLHLTNGYQEGGLIGENPIYYFPWMSAVDKIEYAGRFPFVNMQFTDEEMPFDISLEAFSPFIPHDADNSAIPGAYFNFKIKSKTDKEVQVMLVGSLRNLVAYDVVDKYFISDTVVTPDYKYFEHTVGRVAEDHITNGQMILGAKGGDEVSYYLGWAHRHPYFERMLINKTLGNMDDTPGRNAMNSNGDTIGWIGDNNNQVMKSSVAVSQTLHSKGESEARFFMSWYFPNAYGAIKERTERGKSEPLRTEKGYEIGLKMTEKVGHYYENFYADAREVAQYLMENEDDLSDRSHQFTNDFYATTTDQYILDQVNSHFNTYITSSQFDRKGRFAIREGITSNNSWGPNVTADVSLYGSVSIVSLFPELQKSSMRAHKALQTPLGEINHGLGYDLGKNQNGTFGVYDRVDLVPNYIQLVLRDYLFTNDKDYIQEMWPSVKLGIEYVLKERDHDGDQMPDMDGIMCSYDNFPMYGLASYIQSQWVVAMTLAARVAEDMGEKQHAKTYAKIAKSGAELMEKQLWNGEYFNLSNDYNGDKGIDNGCLTDQLMGQWVADMTGMGPLFDQKKIHASLKTILDYSFIEGDYLRNCTWPSHPDFFPMHNTNLWVDQANTPWTGVELAFASFLIYEGMVAEGKAVIKAVDERYRKSGLYWDHQEFGGHYYRPMSSWAIMNAISGFTLSKNAYGFAPAEDKADFNYFFSANTGTGNLSRANELITLHAATGELSLSSLTLPVNYWDSGIKSHLAINGVKVKVDSWKKQGTFITACFKGELHLKQGDNLTVGTKSGTIVTTK